MTCYKCVNVDRVDYVLHYCVMLVVVVIVIVVIIIIVVIAVAVEMLPSASSATRTFVINSFFILTRRLGRQIYQNFNISRKKVRRNVRARSLSLPSLSPERITLISCLMQS